MHTFIDLTFSPDIIFQLQGGESKRLLRMKGVKPGAVISYTKLTCNNERWFPRRGWARCAPAAFLECAVCLNLAGIPVQSEVESAVYVNQHTLLCLS